MNSFIYKVIFRAHEKFENKNLTLSFINVDFEKPVSIPAKFILELKKISEKNNQVINFQNIEEVLNNLVSNAINYSPEGGRVRITARGLAEYMEVKVEDTGVGIPPEELPKIFDKFYRVKHPKTRQVIGTGLGLSIVKGVIEAHHGTIDVKSVIDKGTTFRILLPMIT